MKFYYSPRVTWDRLLNLGPSATRLAFNKLAAKIARKINSTAFYNILINLKKK